MIIPARLASSRFPEKVLADDTGRPLVQHVVDRVSQCRRVGRVLVAVDDDKTARRLAEFDTPCVMTAVDHASGTDRLAEVVRRERIEGVVVNVQADEPEIDPEVVDGLIGLMESSDAGMATCCCDWPAGERAENPNMVKVVRAADGRALYFSRALIPHGRDAPSAPLLHLGIYAYRAQVLLRLSGLPAGALEQIEKLEQLRALENHIAIDVLHVRHATPGIDTIEQYRAFVARFALNQ